MPQRRGLCKLFTIDLHISRHLGALALFLGLAGFVLVSQALFALMPQESSQGSTPTQEASAPSPASTTTPSTTPTPEQVKLAHAPNGKYDQCGPYYFWYQVSPDNTCVGNYVDLCGITFDISDVIDAFEFVYFTEQRAILDKNRDGISDQYFIPTNNPNVLEWKPYTGCIRIDLRNCGGPGLNPDCGYAMIRIQPKPGVNGGSAKIPISAMKKCPTTGVEYVERPKHFQQYANCAAQSLPDFIVQKKVDKVFLTDFRPEFKYTITVQNTGETKGDTMLIDTITGGTNGGTMELAELKIECPLYARCTALNVSNETIQISLIGLLVNNIVTITYTMRGYGGEIPIDEISYFTNTATLSNGNSSQVIVSIEGSGDIPGRRRPERPRTQR